MRKMTILISNDDGIHAPGLRALAEGLAPLGRVVAVAPDRERSAVGHSVTLHRPLHLRRLKEDWYAVDGTPTDCVHLGIHGLLKGHPELLVSGINEGGNLGDDLTYSGTVSIALEGCLFGVPSIAVSLVAREGFQFEAAASIARSMAEAVLANGLPPGTFLNVNVPNAGRAEALRGIRITRQGRRVFGNGVVESVSPRGKTLHWIGARELGYVQDGPGTDVEAVNEGCVSVTPVRTDLTDHAFLEELRGWRV
jgi:5'-nucleotidase